MSVGRGSVARPEVHRRTSSEELAGRRVEGEHALAVVRACPGTLELVERQAVHRVPALRDDLLVPAARVADLGPELVDLDVDGHFAVSTVVDEHARADARLRQEDAVLRLELGLVEHSDALADEHAGDAVDPVDVAGHDDSSEAARTG